jgi:hypothetical protein
MVCRAFLLALGMLVALGLATPVIVVAQSGIEVHSSSAQSEFPQGISFHIEAESQTGFDSVEIAYRVAPDGVRATARPECVGTTLVNCTFLLPASRRNVLIPGAEVTYTWELIAGADTLETEPQVVTYEDSRFSWSSVTDGNLTVWWYAGGEENAQDLLAAARESLDTASALLDTTIDFPVKVWYYGSAQDMQQAIISENDEGVITLGEVAYSDTAMVAAGGSPRDIARHELAHIVVRHAVGSAYGVPDWLNEGLAVYAQEEPLDNQRAALDQAIASEDVFSVRSLSSASSGALADRVSLYYGQSWSLVNFLLETYGDQKFGDLFAAFAEGLNDDDALMRVYGLDQDGLENAWRESVGLPPRQVPEQEPEATAPAVDKQQTEDASGDASGASVLVVVAIAGMTVALAGSLVVLGVVLARRYR